ncbi:uncharacterized protein LOC143468150 isoform X2 [Clavelina lepadiformis]|uniref:uncharacterized protein LOC143468150 isoform X2 n=1 Tax=Clavelina lepadiformis TaxID=159417 RepID=UPI0040415993
MVEMKIKTVCFIILFLTWLERSLGNLTCVVCNEAESNHECNLQGQVQICTEENASCFTEVRKHGGVYSIKKGCMQGRSCQVQMRQNKSPILRSKRFLRCNDGSDNSVCHQCCNHDWCNLAESPDQRAKNRSCLQFFPICRATWFYARNGFLPESGAFLSCNCDNICTASNDCCYDYHEVCVGVLPRDLRHLDEYGGASGGEYDKVIPRGGGIPLLRCFVCDETESNEECNENGRIEECLPNQKSCVTEIRFRNGRKMISKRCEQKPACQSLQQSAPTCGEGASCLTAFPGYPQCKRSSFSDCMNLALNERCARDRCNCDKDCKLFDDCCDDYDAVCSSGESSNLLWIFEEILRNRNTNLIPSEGAPGRSQSTRSGNSPSHSILEDFPTRLEASPLLIEEMKRERAERVAELLQARRRTGLQEEMTFYDVTNVSNDFKSNQHKQRHSFT